MCQKRQNLDAHTTTAAAAATTPKWQNEGGSVRSPNQNCCRKKKKTGGMRSGHRSRALGTVVRTRTAKRGGCATLLRASAPPPRWGSRTLTCLKIRGGKGEGEPNEKSKQKVGGLVLSSRFTWGRIFSHVRAGLGCNAIVVLSENVADLVIFGVYESIVWSKKIRQGELRERTVMHGKESKKKNATHAVPRRGR